MTEHEIRIGLIINPIAGMGGKTALKGTDGPETYLEALRRGAVPEAGEKAARALKMLRPVAERAGISPVADRVQVPPTAGQMPLLPSADHVQVLPEADRFRILTAGGAMGEEVCERLGLPYEVVYVPGRFLSEHFLQREASFSGSGLEASFSGDLTTAADTQEAVRCIAAAGISLLLFAGGDGTARDICGAFQERPVPLRDGSAADRGVGSTGTGEAPLVLGIPAGVKIQSAVFALTPEDAGAVAAELIRGTVYTAAEREVVDLDEDAYRTGHVSAKLYGVLKVPEAPNRLQSMKEGGFSSEEGQLSGMALYLSEHLEPDVYYAVGSGSTAKCLMRHLGLDYALLGIDVIRNGVLVKKDATEAELWEFAKTGGFKIILSPIGGQGFLVGRGNRQLSPRVLRAAGREGITVIAPEAKLLSFRDHAMHVDSGDPETDAMLCGYYRILCGYAHFAVIPCRR